MAAATQLLTQRGIPNTPGHQLNRGLRKAGLMALGLSDERCTQLDLFAAPENPAVMQTLDAINHRFGAGTIRLAAEAPIDQPGWQMRQDRRSPRYTTRWRDLPWIRL